MDEPIKITSNLEISFFDLMRLVDTDHEFTLRDVLRAVVNDIYIPIEVMQEMLQCRNLKEYYEEAESRPFDNSDSNMEYLELYYSGNIYKNEESPNGISCSSIWDFHGMGKLGYVEDEDVCPIDPELKPTYRQAYAIELTPLYELADYKIKIRPEIIITDDRVKDYTKDTKRIEFQPSITLIELLYSIFWELSFFGSPEKRNEQNENLRESVREIDEAKKNGTLDQITTPWEDIKEQLINEYKNGEKVEEKSETTTKENP